jgi:hypothetical protein
VIFGVDEDDEQNCFMGLIVICTDQYHKTIWSKLIHVQEVAKSGYSAKIWKKKERQYKAMQICSVQYSE